LSEELTTTESAELAALEQQEAELAQAAKAQFENVGIQVPRIDVRQGSTKEPPDDADLGDFFNTVTGVVYGKEIDFLVSAFHKGRFLGGQRSPDGKSYGAGPEAIVPAHWPAQYAGRVFAELPEAQETYSRLVDEGEFAWDKGPAIQDTYVFTGFVIQADGEEVEPFPVNLSLKSTSTKTAKKVITLVRALRNTWLKSVNLTTEREKNAKGEPYFVVTSGGYGVEPTVYQRKGAAELFLASRTVPLVEVGGDDVVQPKAEGAGDTKAETDDVVVPSGQSY
jgi:hypothetical protein